MSPWTAADIPDQTGRTALVTGANAGLGFHAARELAARGATVVLGVRDLDKGRQAVARIRAGQPAAVLTLQELDLGSLDSIATAAAQLYADHRRIDVLINNAGVNSSTKRTTADGFELQFGINYLGAFALTAQLSELLGNSVRGRVVSVTSLAHRQVGAGIDFEDLNWDRRRYDPNLAYAHSKLADLLFTYELHRRLAAAGSGTAALAAHPGLSDSGLSHGGTGLAAWVLLTALRPIAVQPAAKGALGMLRAATDPDARSGQFYSPRGIGGTRGYPKAVGSSALSHDPKLAERLWAASEELTGVTFDV